MRRCYQERAREKEARIPFKRKGIKKRNMRRREKFESSETEKEVFRKKTEK